MTDKIVNDLRHKMEKTIEVLVKEFAGLRAGRAHASLLDPVMVESYGALLPLSQLATVGSPDPRMLSVQVWDRSMVAPIEKAIRESNLGLNPQSDGQLIRVPMPQLSEERRAELAKIAKKYAETARIAIRNARRDGMDTAKVMEKDGEISEDDHKRLSDQVQKLTDEFIKKIDTMLATKEHDIMQV